MCSGDSSRKLMFAIALLMMSPVVIAQDKKSERLPPLPASPCEPHLPSAFSDYRVFNGTAPVPLAMHCGEADSTACHIEPFDLVKPNVFQKDLIAPAAVQGPWTCVQAGGWSGWAPTDRLAPVPATPAITTEQWLGTWSAPRVGRLVLSRSASGHGLIHVEGVATYTNIAHNTSSGEVSGDAVAMGPFLHIVDSGQQSGCILDLKYNLLTKSFRAVDNQQCGGHNVTFNAIWQRRPGFERSALSGSARQPRTE